MSLCNAIDINLKPNDKVKEMYLIRNENIGLYSLVCVWYLMYVKQLLRLLRIPQKPHILSLSLSHTHNCVNKYEDMNPINNSTFPFLFESRNIVCNNTTPNNSSELQQSYSQRSNKKSIHLFITIWLITFGPCKFLFPRKLLFCC